MAQDWFDQNAPQPGLPSPTLPDPNAEPGGIVGPQSGVVVEDPQAKLARFTADYWAPDRVQVLADLQAQASAPAGSGPGAPPPTTTPAPTGGAGAGKDAFGQAWVASGGRTTTDLKNFVAAHPEYGATIGGSKGDKVYGPDGSYWADGVISSGINGGMGATWNTNTGGGAPSTGAGPAGFGSFGQGFGQTFNAPATSTPWQAPTLDQIKNDPGYAGFQFTLANGLKAIDTGAAANGTLLSGGNQKARANYAEDAGNTFAQQAFGNAFQGWQANANLSQQGYQNALGEYLNAYNIFRTDNNDIWSRYNDVSNRGLSAATAATA